MKKTKILIVVLMMLLMLVGCHTQVERVSYNISQQADNFNVTRRLAVINAKSILYISTNILCMSLKT